MFLIVPPTTHACITALVAIKRHELEALVTVQKHFLRDFCLFGLMAGCFCLKMSIEERLIQSFIHESSREEYDATAFTTTRFFRYITFSRSEYDRCIHRQPIHSLLHSFESKEQWQRMQLPPLAKI